ncbi:MAG: hypothetical protein MZU95_00620 [Desulfomicrobium escambiense]|nr:hypothetical protein [Desulfomicrobium escambiense]
MNTVPQRYSFPVGTGLFRSASAITGKLRGEDERTRIEFSIALPDTLGQPGRPVGYLRHLL